MSNLFICNTNYQLIIALCKLEYNDEILIVDENINNYIIKNLINKNINVRELKDFNFLIKSIINYKYKNEMKNYFLTFNKIELFLDHRSLGAFLNKYNINYYLNEDGFNFYAYKYNYSINFRNILRTLLYKFFYKFSLEPGTGKSVVNIEVNDKSIIDKKDERYKKMIEVPRRDLFNSISEYRKKFILDIFNVKEMQYIYGKKSVLLLSQPLYQDNFDKELINSEEDQINYYKSIVDSYNEEYIVYFKVHPRDNTNYNNLIFDNLVFLEKDVPMELYEFVGDYNFDIGITHSSTALDYLSCVKEKIFLKDLRK